MLMGGPWTATKAELPATSDSTLTVDGDVRGMESLYRVFTAHTSRRVSVVMGSFSNFFLYIFFLLAEKVYSSIITGGGGGS